MELSLWLDTTLDCLKRRYDPQSGWKGYLSVKWQSVTWENQFGGRISVLRLALCRFWAFLASVFFFLLFFKKKII